MEGIGIDIIPPPPANPPPAVPVSNSVKKRLDNLRKTQVIKNCQTFSLDDYNHRNLVTFEYVTGLSWDHTSTVLAHTREDCGILKSRSRNRVSVG